MHSPTLLLLTILLTITVGLPTDSPSSTVTWPPQYTGPLAALHRKVKPIPTLVTESGIWCREKGKCSTHIDGWVYMFVCWWWMARG